MILLIFSRAKWISVSGTKYKVGAILHIGHDNDEFPQFWKIKQICVVNSNVDKAMSVVSKKDTLMFDAIARASILIHPIKNGNACMHV